MKFIENEFFKSNGNDDTKKFELKKIKNIAQRSHALLNYYGWAQILFQTVKLFCLNKITIQSFMSLDVTKSAVMNQNELILHMLQNCDDSDNNKLTQSNIFNASENILLLWISTIYNEVTSSKNAIYFNNFTSLSDGIGIGCVIQYYAPHCKEIQQLHLSIQTNDNKRENIQCILNSLKYLGLNISITMDDLLKPTERNMCLFVLYLYQNITKFKAKKVLWFNGVLNNVASKTINLINPSKSKICYNISIEGDSQFTTENDFVILGPRKSTSKKGNKGKKSNKSSSNSIGNSKKESDTRHGTRPGSRQASVADEHSEMTTGSIFHQKEYEPNTKLNVTYKAKFTKLVSAYLILLAKPFPDEKYPCMIPETVLFELKTKNVQIEPCKTIETQGKLYESKEIVFHVTNIYDKNCEFKLNLNNVSNSKHSKLFPLPWHFTKTTLNINSKETIQFSMHYMPFEMIESKCLITFTDNKNGEFVYEVIGKPLLPNPIDTITINGIGNDIIQSDLNIPLRNELLYKARELAMNRLPAGSLKNKIRESLKNVIQKLPCKYNIEITSPYYSGVDIIEFGDNKNIKKNVIKYDISLAPKGPGKYPSQIILKSMYDIRVYVIDGNIQSPGTYAKLKFNTPAYNIIKQMIPIVNTTHEEWKISAKIEGNDFSGKDLLVVKSNSKESYQLNYKPSWIGESSGKLTLHNNNTNENYVYDLIGTAVEPLCSEHIVLECQAKKEVIKPIMIKNVNKYAATYKIESDIPGIQNIDEVVSIQGGSTKRYELKIIPPVSGFTRGNITFTDQKSKYQWFAVELNVLSPDPEQILEISAYLREVVAIEIDLSNPLNEEVVFDIHIHGDGLYGENEFKMEPNSSSVYLLHYSPVIAGQSNGSIFFNNDKIGEFWYQLNLDAKPAKSVQLQDMVCSVGNKTAQTISIENPLNDKIMIETILISNKINFSIQCKRIIIEPLSTKEIEVIYKPTDVNKKNSCSITLKHDKLGEWNYNVVGLGKEPKEMEEPINIYCYLHTKISHVLSFANPFLDQNLKIHVGFDNNDGNVFQLHLKKHEIMLKPNESFQVPIFFSPKNMIKYQSNVKIITEYQKDNGHYKEILWNYPINGIPQYTLTQNLSIKCSTNDYFKKIFSVELPHYICNKGNDNFSMESHLNENDVFNEYFNIKLMKHHLSSNNDKLQFEIKFNPLKKLKKILKLNIFNNKCIKWILRLKIDVNNNSFDDIIKIESPLHTKNSISFTICNEFIKYNKFKAYFVNNAYEFDVTPKSGVLLQKHEGGTTFTLSFLPIEYNGHALITQLIIETELKQWIYKIIGTNPKYIPPNINSFTKSIDNTNTEYTKFKNTMKKKSNKNYIRSNMNSTK